MSERRTLYDEDLVRWSAEQAAALRAAAAARTNLPLDWENIAEEIDTVGRSQRHELRNRTRTLVGHLLKLQCSRSTDPKRGWVITVRRTRQEIEDLIKDSPSLRSERDSVLADVLGNETDLTARELAAAGEMEAVQEVRLCGPDYGVDQVFGDWFPETAGMES